MSATLLQALYATGLGFAFAAVTLRTGALWPLIVIHFLMDLAGFLTVAPAAPTGLTAAHVGLTGLYAVSFVIYGALVLRTTPGTRAMARPSSQAQGNERRRCRRTKLASSRKSTTTGSRPTPHMWARGRRAPRDLRLFRELTPRETLEP